MVSEYDYPLAAYASRGRAKDTDLFLISQNGSFYLPPEFPISLLYILRYNTLPVSTDCLTYPRSHTWEILNI